MLFQQPIPDAEQTNNAEQQQQYVDGLGETRGKDIAGCFEKSIPELAKTAYEANTKRFRVCPSVGKAVVIAGIKRNSRDMAYKPQPREIQQPACCGGSGSEQIGIKNIAPDALRSGKQLQNRKNNHESDKNTDIGLIQCQRSCKAGGYCSKK